MEKGSKLLTTDVRFSIENICSVIVIRDSNNYALTRCPLNHGRLMKHRERRSLDKLTCLQKKLPRLACIQKFCTTIYYQSIIRVCIVGELRYNVVFNKRRHDWITRKLYASKTADFQPALMQCLVERRMDASITLGQSTLDLVLPDLPANIGGQYRVKPTKADAIAKHRSRFGCQP